MKRESLAFAYLGRFEQMVIDFEPDATPSTCVNGQLPVEVVTA
jgi:hypothetical protein